jgi:hypothetical protein
LREPSNTAKLLVVRVAKGLLREFPIVKHVMKGFAYVLRKKDLQQKPKLLGLHNPRQLQRHQDCLLLKRLL